MESGSTLHFEFLSEGGLSKQIIHISKVNEISVSPRELTNQLIEKYHVPKLFHFPLFQGVRIAHGFSDYEKRVQLINIQLIAFSLTIQETNILEPPSFIEELIELISTNDPTIPQVLFLSSFFFIFHFY